MFVSSWSNYFWEEHHTMLITLQCLFIVLHAHVVVFRCFLASSFFPLTVWRYVLRFLLLWLHCAIVPHHAIALFFHVPVISLYLLSAHLPILAFYSYQPRLFHCACSSLDCILLHCPFCLLQLKLIKQMHPEKCMQSFNTNLALQPVWWTTHICKLGSANFLFPGSC